MLKLVTSERQITEINTRFRNRLSNESETVRTKLGMQGPGGGGDSTLYWHPEVPIWGCFEKRETRYWNVFGSVDPTDFRPQAPVCEINPATNGVNQKVGGAYAIDDATGSVLILHNGKIGGGKKGIGKSLFWKKYGKKRPQVQIEHEGQTLTYALVMILDDPDALKHLGRFVYLIDRIKSEKSIRKSELDNFGHTTPESSREPLFLICPAAGEASVTNLAKSIESTISKNRLITKFPTLKTELGKISDSDEAWAWGLRPSPGNDRTWERLAVGDEIALFTGDELRYHARITQKIDSAPLADDIWGQAEDGRSFAQTFFLTQPSPISVPRDLFNDLLAYNYDRSPQGTFILDGDRAIKLRRHISRLISTDVDSISDLITVTAQAHPELGKTLLNELLYGEDVAPVIRLFEPSLHLEAQPWDIRPGGVDYSTMLKKLERRNAAHNEIVLAMAVDFGSKGRKVAFSDYIDLLVDGNIILEVKTIVGNPVRQVRAALAQLYHYRFAYRAEIVNAKLIAVFSDNLRLAFPELANF